MSYSLISSVLHTIHYTLTRYPLDPGETAPIFVTRSQLQDILSQMLFTLTQHCSHNSSHMHCSSLHPQIQDAGYSYNTGGHLKYSLSQWLGANYEVRYNSILFVGLYNFICNYMSFILTVSVQPQLST